MPKYLVQASYTAEGIKGLLKDGGSQRRAAAAGAVSRSVTRRKVIVGDLPSDRDASSRPIGTCARPARTLTSARGRNSRT